MSNEENQDNQNNARDRDVEVLPEDYASYDLSFKIIVIGNSGKII
jgi:hypothetical protein